MTYISGRASGLMAFLYLSAFFLYIKASKEEDHAPVRRLYLAGAVVSYLLSFGAKETAMTFPFVLVLWDVLIPAQSRVSASNIFHLPCSVLARALCRCPMGLETPPLYRSRPIQS